MDRSKTTSSIAIPKDLPPSDKRIYVTREFKLASEQIPLNDEPRTLQKFAPGQYKVRLESEILRCDLNLNPEVKTRFSQWLLFITLNLIDNYDTPHVLALLKKDEDELLQAFWNLHTDLPAYPPIKIATYKVWPGSRAAQHAAELHRISLFRYLLEVAGGNIYVRQHKLDKNYKPNDNANIYGSMNGISGSKPFGTFDSKKMLDALSKSPVFTSDTIRDLDIMKVSAKIMGYLPIGFPDEFSDLPFHVLGQFSCGEIEMIRAQVLHFYRDRPSLKTKKNNLLVLLASNPFGSAIEQILLKWAVSVDGLRLYKRIITDIQDSQTKEQLGLNLAALLCYQQYFTPFPKAKQPIKGSYLTDFDAILKGERLSNEQTVSERMIISFLRVFYTVKDNERIRPFLATVLNTVPPTLEPRHEVSDRYWTCRINDEVQVPHDHKDAFEMTELEYLTGKEAAPAIGGEEGPVTSQEEMGTSDDGEKVDVLGDGEFTDILDDEEEQEEEEDDDCWVIVKAPSEV